MPITITLPDNGYAHPLYVEPRNDNHSSAYIEYDPSKQTLIADTTIHKMEYDDGTHRWSISNQILSSDLEVLLNLIKDGLENGTIDPLAIGHTLETGQHDTPELALIAESADPYNDRGMNRGIEDTQSAGNMDLWGSDKYPDMDSLLEATDDDLRAFFIWHGYDQEDDYGDRHSISGDATELGLLTAWRGAIEAYRAEKATV